MTISRDLFLAILSMDSYNRDYGFGVKIAGTKLGNARLLSRDSLNITQQQYENWQASGFYAIAYDMSDVAGFADGERVISYRGTNYDGTNGLSEYRDTWNGWTAGAGFPQGSQAQLALQFYRAVAGREAVQGTNPDIVLTGHSLGGGLAGFIGALSNGEAVMFDHMPFLMATVAQFWTSYRDALEARGMSLDTEPTDEVLATLGLAKPSIGEISGYYLEGEINRLLRNGSAAMLIGGVGALVPVLGAAIYFLGGWIAGGQLGETALLGASVREVLTFDWDKAYDEGITSATLPSADRHIMATLVISMYAREQPGFGAWQTSGVSDLIFDALYDPTIARSLPVRAELIGAKSSAVAVMRTAIAYSALDSGERPFGDVAIRAMFDDAGNFGTVLQTGRMPAWLGDAGNAAIGRIIVEFAGLMALRDVEAFNGQVGGPNAAALSGVIALDNVNNPYVMRISFGDELWGLGGDVHESHERKRLVSLAIDANSSNAQIERISTWYGEEVGGNLVEDIDEIVFAFGNGLVPPSAASGLSLVIAGDAGVNTTLDDNNHFVITGAGADTITGGTGVDIIISGDGAGEVHGGGGNDYLVGGANGDQLFGDDDDDYLDGGYGVDLLEGGGGNDRLVASLDNETDTLNGGAGNDTVVYAYDGGDSKIRIRAAGTQPAVGVQGQPAGFGLHITDALNAGGGAGQFGGDALNSIELASVQAGSGADTLKIDSDAEIDKIDYIDLGRQPDGGYDYVDLSNWTADVTVDLSQNIVELPQATISVRGADAVIGSSGNDTITGNDDANKLFGGEGDDTLQGGGGNDTLEGGVDNDQLDGDAANDILKGGAGEDQLRGGTGNDIIDGRLGEDNARADQLYGGADSDRFLANNGDVIHDLDADDQAVQFNAVVLRGGLRKKGDDFYTGVVGERYTYSGGDLIVTFRNGAYAGQRLTIKNFANGAGQIKLRNQDDKKEPNPGDNFPSEFPSRDPLVLDLNGNGVTLTNLALSGARFDLDQNGFAETTGWIAAGEGLLALDANRNGTIDNGSELFGNATFNGFEMLARYDDNRDGHITNADAIWNSLLVWRDANGDGVSQAAEITSITTEAIAGINLSARDANGRSREGNTLLAVGDYLRPDGFRAEAVAVAFASNPTASTYEISDDFEYDPEVFELPNLKGFGELPDLWVAMSLDPVLKQMVQDLVAGSYESIADLVGTPYEIRTEPRVEFGIFRDQSATFHYRASAFEDMLARWAGVPIVPGSFDEYQVELIAERLIGQEITIGTGFARRDFHNAFWRNSMEYAARFVIAWADAAQNGGTEQQISEILEQLSGNVSVSEAAVLQQTLDALLNGESEVPELSPFLQRYSMLEYDAVSNRIVGDVSGFIDQELRSFTFNPENPYEGWSEWLSPRAAVLAVADPDGSVLDERRRAYTGNRMLGVFLTPESGIASRVTGDGIVRGDAGLNVLSGGSGDDILMGGGSDDAYIFSDGFGQDIVVDSAGGGDELAFQGGLTSNRARVQFEGNRRDIRITFDGSADSVLIRDFFDELGRASIERVTFPDGPAWDARSVRDRAFASLATGGADRIRGTLPGTTILGGAGNDNLGYSLYELRNAPLSQIDWRSFVGDIFVGGAGDDVLQGAWGQDVYRFSRGDGHDTIFDIDGLAIVQFDETISAEDIVVKVAENGENIVLWIGGNQQSITLQQFFYHWRGDEGYKVFTPSGQPFQLLFSDGSIWSFNDLLTRALQGTDGADILAAYSGGSTLMGAEGNDRLLGSIGDDIHIGGQGDDQFVDEYGEDEFRFSLGDGHDVITVGEAIFSDSLFGANDILNGKTIAFDNTVNFNDVTIEQGNDGKSLIIRVFSADQSITITDFMQAINRSMEALDRIKLTFVNGPMLNGRQLLNLALAPTSGDDVHIGSVYDDAISGGNGDDELLGGVGSNIHNFGHDTLDGGAGNDLLVGRGGIDTLVGGTGNDILRGGYGADIHRFALGDGHDVVEFAGLGDEIVFAGDIAQDDLVSEIAENGSDLILWIAGQDQSITLPGVVFNNGWGSNQIRFAEGPSKTIGDLILAAQVPTTGDDIIRGSYHGGILSGDAGNDQIHGGTADETIDGGTGDDTLSGGGGTNIFRFGIGSGTDRIVPGGTGYSSHDAVEFGPGISPEQLQISASDDGREIVLAVSGTTDRLIFDRRLSPTFRFLNNTVSLSTLDLLGGLFGATPGNDVIVGGPTQRILEGLEGNDFLSSFYGNTIFVGGRGNDVMEGSRSRPDVYRFSLGDGQDRIIDTINQDFGDDEYFQNPGVGFEGNVLEFGEGISSTDVHIFEYLDNGIESHLILISGTDGRIIVRSNSQNTEFHITEMRFADGTVVRDGFGPPILGLPSINNFLGRGTVTGSSITGSSSSETLDGRGIIHSLVGNGGSDVFIFNRGYGELTIDQTQTGSFVSGQPPFASTLRFGAGISSNDVDVSSNEAGDLILSLGNGDQVTLLRGRSEGPRPYPYVTESFSGVMRLEFADGSSLQHEDLIRRIYEGFDGGEGGYQGNTTLVGDAFGGVFDTHGVANEIYTRFINDQIVYGRGYGELRVHVEVPTNSSNDYSTDGGVKFYGGLTLADAEIRIGEDGSLIFDFGGGDVLTVVGALDSEAGGQLYNHIYYYTFDNITYSINDLIDEYNGRLIVNDTGEPTTLAGNYFDQYFDPLGAADVIDGGGGWDDVYYERGYGEITIRVAPDLGRDDNNFENIVFLNFGPDISAENLTIRSGGENELVIDLGNGDIIRLQFERDPALDLSDRTYPDPYNDGEQLYYGGALSFYFEDGTSLEGPAILGLVEQNEAPTIGTGDFGLTSDALVGTSIALVGQFGFDDADVNDAHVISVTGLSVTGATTELPSEDELLSYLFAQISEDTDVGQAGEARWIFSAEAGTFDYLAEGETVTLAYDVEISDGRLGTFQQIITIVINGTNEAPVIVGGAAGATLLPANAPSGTTGQLVFTDTDMSQSHTVSITAASSAGGGAGLPSEAVLRQWLNTSIVAGSAGSHQLNWSFAPQGFDFSSLDLSDQLTLTYTLAVGDSSGAVATRDITIVIRASELAAGLLSSVAGTVFEEDNAVALALPASLFAGALDGSITVSVGLADGSPLPSWLAFDGSHVTGTPPANFNGTIELRVTANNGVDAVHDFLPLVIESVNDAPEIGDRIADHLVASGAAVDLLIPQTAFADVDGETLSLTATLSDGSALPAWLEFDNGRFVGTPPAGYAGILNLRIVASDSISQVEQLFTMAIGTANAPPSFGNPLFDWIVREDAAISIALREGAFRDANGDALTITAQLANGDELPLWLTFDGTRFAGNPPQDFNGILDVSVRASDGIAHVTDTFRLTIDPVNDAPTVVQTLSNVTFAGGAAISIDIPASTFSDVDGDAIAVSMMLANGSPLPSWLSFDGTTLTGTPPAGFAGTLNFAVQGSDGPLSVSTAFALTISSGNAAPTANDDIVADIAEDGSIIISPAALLANDLDANADPLSIAAVGNPLGGQVEMLADGNVRFVAALNYSGPASFEYEVSDGFGGSDTAVARFNVLQVNDAPTAVSLTNATINENSAAGTVVGTLSATDVDIADTHSFQLLATTVRLDEALRLDPNASVSLAFTGADSGQNNTGLRLTSMGRYTGASAQGSYTVWRVRNTNSSAQTVRLNASSGGFDRTLTVDPMTDTYIISRDIAGSATHRLYRGTTLIDTKAASGSVFTSSMMVSLVNPLFEIVGNQLVVRGGANLDFERLSTTSVTIQATDTAGASIIQTLQINIADVLDYNIITGTLAANTLTGSAFADDIRGLDGNDILTGAGGNDILNGGSGSDKAIFAGAQSTYTIAVVGGTLTVVDTDPVANGDTGADTIIGIEQLQFAGGQMVNITSPILLDLDGNGVRTVSAADSRARYDMDGDGLADDTSWFGSTEGMLFLDRDGNGTVTNAGEFSFVDDVEGAKSDLEGLRAFDSNADGLLSSLDARFAEFRVWIDRDGDGAAEEGEIQTLTQAGVRSLNLTGTAVDGTVNFGEVAVLNKGSYTRTNGTVMEFLDAAFTYFSSATNLPQISVQQLSFARKADKYLIAFAGGEMTLNPRKAKGDLDARAGALTASAMLSFKGKTFGMLSPIILDLDGDGVEMLSIKKARAAFDMNGDGVADDTGWAGKGDGFLVIDRNNDGRISDASELSFAAEDKDARSDLEALAALDNNGDGVLDKDDVRFGELKVWIDANGNGVSEEGELKTLTELGITEIGLRAQNREGYAKVGENVLLSTATFTRENGSTGTLGNVALAYTPGNVIAGGGASGIESDGGRLDIAAELPIDGPVDEALLGSDIASTIVSTDALVAALDSNAAQLRSGPLGWDVPANVDPFDYFATALPDNEPADTSVQSALQAAEPDGQVQGIARTVEADPIASVLMDNVGAQGLQTDRLLALIRQDMATFGARVGEQELARRDGGVRPLEFYA